ncbi:MAG: hypothetical protein AKCLJLPJ_00035 [Fimbriimonadales bacterium]|nr:hypothetical protein [Fimbriimonadales bacterium]
MGRDHPEQPKQIGNGGRDLRGWAILDVGVPLIYIGATYTAQPSHRADSTPHPADGTHSWNNELVGTQVQVPLHDSQGYGISRNGDRMTIVAVSCFSCSDYLSALEHSDRRPLIVFVDSELVDVPASLRGRPSDYLLICRSAWPKENSMLYTEMPQAAEVDKRLTVIRVPEEDQSLAGFLKGGS